MMGGFYWPLRDWNAGQRVRRRGFRGSKTPSKNLTLHSAVPCASCIITDTTVVAK